MKEELIGFDDWKWERQKSSKLLYTLLKSIEKEVNEPALVTYLKVMNEKCGNDLILTEMITLKFREYIVPIIYLGIFHFLLGICVSHLFNIDYWFCFYSYLYFS